MTQSTAAKTARRLIAAEGYLELQMLDEALAELNAAEEATFFEAEICYLRGEAFKSQEMYPLAIENLQRAAELLPDPFDKLAWLSLSECFDACHEPEMAALAQEAALEVDGFPEVEPEADLEVGVPAWFGKFTDRM